MPSVSRVPSLDGTQIRLIVDGGWTSEADRALERGEFDRLELQRGEYAHLKCLMPHARNIRDLWVNALCKSTTGIESLSKLTKLQLGFPADRDLNFRELPELREVVLEHWKPYYARSLFECDQLVKLSIDNYSESTCEKFGSLSRLRSLSLFGGALRALDGLSKCRELDALVASNVKNLQLIDDLAGLDGVRRIELREKLPAVRDVTPVFELDKLRHLDLKGCATTIPSLMWLERFSDLQVLLLPPVDILDWRSLFLGKPLKMLWLALRTESQANPEEAAQAARSCGLVPTEAKRLGKGDGSAILLRFE